MWNKMVVDLFETPPGICFKTREKPCDNCVIIGVFGLISLWISRNCQLNRCYILKTLTVSN